MSLVLIVLLLACLFNEIVFALSLFASIIHSYEEVAEEPIWDYLGRFYHLPRVPYLVGLSGLVLFVLLQIALAYFGYTQNCTSCLIALGVIRLGDTVISHVVPYLCGARPNPGIVTTVLYALEVVLICSLLF